MIRRYARVCISTRLPWHRGSRSPTLCHSLRNFRRIRSGKTALRWSNSKTDKSCCSTRKLSRYSLPVIRQMLRGPPCQRLRRQSRIPGTTGAHHRSPQYPQILHLVGEAKSVGHIGGGIVAHARATIGVCGGSHGAAQSEADNVDGTSSAIPLFHSVLGEGGDAQFIVPMLRSDADNGKTKCVLDLRIQVQIVAAVGQRGLLDVGGVSAI